MVGMVLVNKSSTICTFMCKYVNNVSFLLLHSNRVTYKGVVIHILDHILQNRLYYIFSRIFCILCITVNIC